MENLMTAFEIAEKHLDIPKMLDPEGETDSHLPHSVILPSPSPSLSLGTVTVTFTGSGH